jgi:hypothetical protein
MVSASHDAPLLEQQAQQDGDEDFGVPAILVPPPSDAVTIDREPHDVRAMLSAFRAGTLGGESDMTWLGPKLNPRCPSQGTSIKYGR